MSKCVAVSDLCVKQKHIPSSAIGRMDKMRPFMYLILFATGCGGSVVVELPHPCESADFVSGGVCVITNGYNVDPNMVEFTVDIIETGINEGLDRNDDLPVLLGDLMVSAEYVDPYDPKLAEDGERAYRGLAIGTKTIINYMGEGGPECHEHYYVLGHELLHVISQYILEAPSWSVLACDGASRIYCST
ncbi:MAG: hypothetical protein ACXAC5_03855 [Promethearchaeota archaeon]